MAKTDSFYTKEETLLELPKGKDTIKVMIGHKTLRGEAKLYLDIRVWYLDDLGIRKPGKGFAKPVTEQEMAAIAQAIDGYVHEGKVLEVHEF